MKSNLFLSSLLSVSLLCISCKKEEEAEVTTTETPKEIIIPNAQSAATAQTFGQQPTTQNVAAAPTQTITPQGITPAQMTPQAVTKAGMNPPHGQAGHRCDIAVGAPLNSPATPQAKSTGSGATITSMPTSASGPAFTTTDSKPVVTAPGMNPPHGQPGHVCGTPVGSPLPTDGAPATITPATVTPAAIESK